MASKENPVTQYRGHSIFRGNAPYGGEGYWSDATEGEGYATLERCKQEIDCFMQGAAEDHAEYIREYA